MSRTSPMPDLTLADLRTDAWTPVARKVRVTQYLDGWEWHLSPAEVSALQIGVVHGSVLTAHAFDANGNTILKAKRKRPSGAAERFAVMGRGLFER
jgi:hypothetical protein